MVGVSGSVGSVLRALMTTCAAAVRAHSAVCGTTRSNGLGVIIMTGIMFFIRDKLNNIEKARQDTLSAPPCCDCGASKHVFLQHVVCWLQRSTTLQTTPPSHTTLTK